MSERENRDPGEAGSAAAVKERAELGKEILGSRVAQGEPGTKQPPHDDPRLSAAKTVEKLDEVVKQFESPVYESSLVRSQREGNLNSTPPHERSIQRGPQVLAAAATAAGAIGAARDALTSQLEADARLVSDPRYERDQKVYELGQQGKLAFVPPTQAEQAVAAARAGAPPEVVDMLPTTPEEQVAQDMPRLQAAEKRAASVSAGVVPPGQQDMADKNNGKTAQEEGRTGEAAVARAKASETSQAVADSSPGRPTNVATGTSPIDQGNKGPTAQPQNTTPGSVIK